MIWYNLEGYEEQILIRKRLCLYIAVILEEHCLHLNETRIQNNVYNFLTIFKMYTIIVLTTA